MLASFRVYTSFPLPSSVPAPSLGPSLPTLTAPIIVPHHPLLTLTMSSITAQHNALPAMIPSKITLIPPPKGKKKLAPNPATSTLSIDLRIRLALHGSFRAGYRLEVRRGKWPAREGHSLRQWQPRIQARSSWFDLNRIRVNQNYTVHTRKEGKSIYLCKSTALYMSLLKSRDPSKYIKMYHISTIQSSPLFNILTLL